MPEDDPKPPPQSPYRAPAPVMTLIPGPPPLWPFKPWNISHRLITLPGKGEPTTTDRTSDVFCDKCAQNTLVVVTKLCTGRVVGFCKKVVCAERRPHFHVRCTECEWSVLMATHADMDAGDK